MPSPPGDLTLFGRQLQQAPSLVQFAKVLAGKKFLIAGGSPPRIVLFMVGAVDGAPFDPKASVSSAWMLVTAHLWANGEDEAFDLRTRFFQALYAQAAATDGSGYYWKCPEGENERWDVEPDSEQGAELEIDIVIAVDATKETQATGTVEATSLTRVPTLTADVGADDLAVAVDATIDEPEGGILIIDDEQMSFSIGSSTSFTITARGINGTTPAAHAAGAPVYVALS